MSLTKIVNKLYFQPRRRELDRYVTDGEAIQREVMQYLVERAKDTEYGRKHLFSTIKSYEDFVQNIPVNTYEELKSDIDRMRHGERNILWPGQVRWYAKSSGTTNDKSKFIPVSQRDYRQFIIKVVRTLSPTTLAITQKVASSMVRVSS